MQKLPTRLERLLDFHEENPADTFILFALAKEYENMGELESSLQFFNKLLEADPNYIGAFYHLGKLYEQLSKPEKAYAVYKTGMEVARKRGDDHALHELAAARLNLGDEEDFE